MSERAKFKAETLSNVGGRVLTTSLKESGAGALAVLDDLTCGLLPLALMLLLDCLGLACS
jgi:hypothetical protein